MLSGARAIRHSGIYGRSSSAAAALLGALWALRVAALALDRPGARCSLRLSASPALGNLWRWLGFHLLELAHGRYLPLCMLWGMPLSMLSCLLLRVLSCMLLCMLLCILSCLLLCMLSCMLTGHAVMHAAVHASLHAAVHVVVHAVVHAISPLLSAKFTPLSLLGAALFGLATWLSPPLPGV